jgi:hypothetical protein
VAYGLFKRDDDVWYQLLVSSEFKPEEFHFRGDTVAVWCWMLCLLSMLSLCTRICKLNNLKIGAVNVLLRYVEVWNVRYRRGRQSIITVVVDIKRGSYDGHSLPEPFGGRRCFGAVEGVAVVDRLDSIRRLERFTQ